MSNTTNFRGVKKVFHQFDIFEKNINLLHHKIEKDSQNETMNPNQIILIGES